jgi:hypothetical protein
MSNIRTHYISLEKVQAKGKDGILILQIAVAVNDIMDANRLLTMSKELKDRDMGKGIGMYSIKLQIAHLREASSLIDAVAKSPSLLKYVVRMSQERQAQFDLLKNMLPNNKDEGKFSKVIRSPRNQIVFHYGPKNSHLFEDALAKILKRNNRTIGKVTGGDEHTARFQIADKVIDAAMCWEMWGIDHSLDDNTQKGEIDTILDWAHERSIAFLEFGFDLCNQYFTECAAI